MKKVELHIRGLKPFLYHKFNIESISDQNKIKEGTAGNNPSEWKSQVWNEGKKLFVPGFYFLPAFAAGGSLLKWEEGRYLSKFPPPSLF